MRIVLIILTFVALKSHAQDQAIANEFFRKWTGEVCGQNENYMNEEINRIRQKKTLSSHLLQYLPFPQTVVKRSCVQSALKQVTAGRELEQTQIDRGLRKKESENNFIRCVSGKKVIEHQETPCQNRDSILLIHNSFELVTGCLKDYVSGSADIKVQNQWAQTYFKMLTKESGLQNYVTSQSDALGISQLTTTYIRDFMDKSLDDVKAHLAASAHPICKSLGNEILSTAAVSYFARKNKNNSYSYNKCALIGVEHNQILRNLLIGFSNLKLYRGYTRQSAFRGNSQVQMSAEQQLKLELQMVPLAYNMGPGAVERSIDTSLASYSKKRPAQNADELMRLIIRNAETKEGRDYLGNIEERFNKVIRDSGQTSCFQ
jgi:hypothetical protein